MHVVRKDSKICQCYEITDILKFENPSTMTYTKGLINKSTTQTSY